MLQVFIFFNGIHNKMISGVLVDTRWDIYISSGDHSTFTIRRQQ